MLDTLEVVLDKIPELTRDASRWESLVINRRKPYTFRAFTNIGGLRVCLHRFEGCDPQESFYHPHPWPGAFIILEGAYNMKLGYSADRESPPKPVAQIKMVAGSRYEIIEPMTWHTVEPITDVVYTVMINGQPWKSDVAHSEVRTTKGKDLEAMPPEMLRAHLDKFAELTGWHCKRCGEIVDMEAKRCGCTTSPSPWAPPIFHPFHRSS